MTKREDTVAAIFDFDGIWFHKGAGWQIRDIRFGQIGSILSWTETYKTLVKARKRNPNIKLLDHFAFPKMKWAEVHKCGEKNITSPSTLLELARRFQNLNYDLYVISQSDCREFIGMTDNLFEKPKLIPIHKNPFEEVELIYKPSWEGTMKKNLEHQIIQEKISQITSLLRYKAGIRKKRKQKPLLWAPDINKIYDRIFLYFTQMEYETQIYQFIEEEKDFLTARTMAIIPSYIANSI